MRRFRVPQVECEGTTFIPDAEVAHHLRVIHLRRGERVVLFDGGLTEAVAVLVDPMGPTLTIEAVRPATTASHDLHLLIGLPKGPAMDLAIRVATEAGATHVWPVATERAVPKGDRVDRWERIAESAAEQCGRGDVPVIHPLRTFAEVLRTLPANLDFRVALPGAPRLPAATGPAAVLIGPEGGLTDTEVQTALQHGARPMGLGRFILRTDTAAAVAVAMVAGGSAHH